MADTAKLFITGRSQAVRLPRAYRLEGSEVFIRRDPATGDVVLSRRPETWQAFWIRPPVSKYRVTSWTSADIKPRPREIYFDGVLARHKYCERRHQGLSIVGALIQEFLIRVEVLPWTAEVANVYGDLRASCAQRGISLSALDMMIAAHAVAIDAVLITRDKSFDHVDHGLKLEHWEN